MELGIIPPDSADDPPLHKFASTQIELPHELHEAFHDVTKDIPDEDLAEDGRETEPHITVKYGLHADGPEPVQNLLDGEGPITAKLGHVSIFPADETETQRGSPQYDVVKLDVDSPRLAELNKKISTLPHTDTHPKYQPHMTLAYVKVGEGKKYIGATAHGLTGKNVVFDSVTFSGKDRHHESIPLIGAPGTADQGEDLTS